MNPAEIKIDLFRKLDSLKGNRLKEAYDLLLNFINNKNEIDEWANLSPDQQHAIQLGIKQLDKGEGRQHKDVVSHFRSKFIND